MSRYLSLFIVGCTLVLSGCLESDASEPVNEEHQRTLLLNARIDSLSVRNAELEEEAQLKHQFLEEYITLINRTLADLEGLTQREGMIQQMRVEIETNESGNAASHSGSIGQRLADNLQAIDRYIAESQKQREALERQRAELNRIARSRAVEVSSFEETIQQLNGLIEEKEETIRVLRQEAEHMLARIDRLSEKNTVLVEENTELREAYYVVGTRDELMDQGIIDRRGGFLSIGRKTRIEQLNAEKFHAANVETAEIYLGEDLKAYQILTNHRTNEALFDFVERDGGVYLAIPSPEEFWKVSRYLIVEVKS